MGCDLSCGFRRGFRLQRKRLKNCRAKSQILVKEQVGGDNVKIGLFSQKDWLIKKGWDITRELGYTDRITIRTHLPYFQSTTKVLKIYIWCSLHSPLSLYWQVNIFLFLPYSNEGEQESRTYIVKLSSVIIHLKYTDYIFIHSISIYWIPITCLALHQALGTQRRKTVQQCKMAFPNHYINKPCFIST